MISFASMSPEQIEQTRQEAASFEISNTEQLEEFRLKYLSKKGLLNRFFEDFRNLEPALKKSVGKPLNELKKFIEDIFEEKKSAFGGENKSGSADFDSTLPVSLFQPGGVHPISSVINTISDIFIRQGFEIATGPEVEDDWHNFSALNFGPDHPARDMQDTFFTEDGGVLRTHTSSVQIRVMENHRPPLRLLAPGRVYRNEAVSSRSNCFFHQIEGFYVDENVSFADLKQTLFSFVKEFFGEHRSVRFRPSYFPFTEPSAEMDVWLGTDTEEDRRLTKGTGWLEILGCGMIHPNVLRNCNIDPDQYSGFAFGLGIDRIAMLRYGVKDIRDFFENNIHFIKQFASI